MINLQTIVGATTIQAKENPREVKETKPLAEYKGLTLVEAVDYRGGTSIKYWM